MIWFVSFASSEQAPKKQLSAFTYIVRRAAGDKSTKRARDAVAYDRVRTWRCVRRIRASRTRACAVNIRLVGMRNEVLKKFGDAAD